MFLVKVDCHRSCLDILVSSCILRTSWLNWQNHERVQIHREGRRRGAVYTNQHSQWRGFRGECDGRGLDKVVVGAWHAVDLRVYTVKIDMKIAAVWYCRVWSPPLIGQFILGTNS